MCRRQIIILLEKQVAQKWKVSAFWRVLCWKFLWSKLNILHTHAHTRTCSLREQWVARSIITLSISVLPFVSRAFVPAVVAARTLPASSGKAVGMGRVKIILYVRPGEEIKWRKFRRKKLPSERAAFASPFPRKPSIQLSPEVQCESGGPSYCWYNFSWIISEIFVKILPKYLGTLHRRVLWKKNEPSNPTVWRKEKVGAVSCTVSHRVRIVSRSRQILALSLQMESVCVAKHSFGSKIKSLSKNF